MVSLLDGGGGVANTSISRRYRISQFSGGYDDILHIIQHVTMQIYFHINMITP
jgi:hypothetical protein